MIVGKAIYYLLTNATDVTDVVSTRIYPEVAQQDSDLPFIVYNVTNNEPTDTKPEPSKLDTAQVEVNIYAESYTEAIDLAVAVRAALDRVKGTYNGVNVQSIQYQNEVIDFDEPQRAYNISADYDVRISRSGFEIAQGSPITGVQLGELSDVNVTGVTDNQILSYDAASDTWVPAADAGGPDVLDDLSDVDAGSPSAGQLLAYGQDTWETIDQDELTLPIGSVTGLQTELNTIPDGLDDLDDVKIIGTPSEGDALVYQSGFFSLGTAGASTLGDLTDVNTTGAGVGSLIQFNGSSWDISAAELPDDAVYYHNRYASKAETLLDGATETVELYYTAQADGDGLHEDAQTDTPTSGFDIRRKLYYAEKAQADPDTSADWTQFTAIADNTTFANAKAALLAYLKERTGGTVPISLKMTWEEVAQAPAFTGLLNESYGSGAEAAYSTRRLNGNVTECMVIRRASDSTTTTIGFDGSGNIDEAAIETFCTGTTCTVYQWLDQSGNGNDATAPSTGEEPTIYTGGALVKEGGKLALDFDGSNDKFQLGLSITNADSLSYFYTGNYIGSGPANQWMVQTSESPQLFVPVAEENDTNTSIIFGVSSTSYYASGTSVTLANRGDVYAAFAGKQTLSSIFGSSAVTLSNSYLGGRVANNYMVNGLFQEFILYTANKSTDRTSIEENIGNYYTQNTPLLDTYSGAAAAYSLRLLDSTYTGALINVWNGTSYADIYPNVFGELDTVALAAHCGSNDGFIRYWYDQSSNSNTASQTTTANMPKIYDGTTGVVTENGKPAVEFDGSNDVLKTSSVLISGTVGRSMFVTAKADTISTDSIFSLTDNGSGTGALWQFTPEVGVRVTGSQLFANNPMDVQTLGSVHLAASSNIADIEYFENGVQATATSLGTTDPINTSSLGVSEIGGSDDKIQWFYDGNIQEIVMYASDQSSNRANIEDNINTFYSIY